MHIKKEGLFVLIHQNFHWSLLQLFIITYISGVSDSGTSTAPESYSLELFGVGTVSTGL